MADGLCTGDAARRKNNTIEEQQGVNEKHRCRGDKLAKECGRIAKNGFLIDTSVIGGDQLCCGVDGLCPKHHDEGFIAEEMPAEDDCRKKRCVDRYDSSESSDRQVFIKKIFW